MNDVKREWEIIDYYAYPCFRTHTALGTLEVEMRSDGQWEATIPRIDKESDQTYELVADSSATPKEARQNALAKLRELAQADLAELREIVDSL